MKTVLLSIVGALLIVASGCQTGVTIGTKANETEVLGAAAGSKGASLTLPFVKAEVKPTETVKKRK
jgi:hypothetical protein